MKQLKTTNSKLLLFVVVIIITFFSGFSENVAAAGFELSASSVEGDAGDQVIVSILAGNAAGSEGGQYLLKFNPDLVKPVDLQTGDLITSAANNMHMSNLEYLPGELIFMWVTPEADTEDSGVICEITFELVKEGEAALHFDEIVIVPEEIVVEPVEPAAITIGKDLSGVSSGSDVETTGDSEGDDEVEVVTENETEVDSEDELVLAESEDTNNFSLYIAFIVVVLAFGLFIYSLKVKKKRA